MDEQMRTPSPVYKPIETETNYPPRPIGDSTPHHRSRSNSSQSRQRPHHHNTRGSPYASDSSSSFVLRPSSRTRTRTPDRSAMSSQSYPLYSSRSSYYTQSYERIYASEGMPLPKTSPPEYDETTHGNGYDPATSPTQSRRSSDQISPLSSPQGSRPATPVSPMSLSSLSSSNSPTLIPSSISRPHSPVPGPSNSNISPIINPPPKAKKPVKRRIRARKFMCEHEGCGLFFTRPSGLIEHMRSHTGERPHKCKLCHRSFAALSNWRRHMKTCESALLRDPKHPAAAAAAQPVRTTSFVEPIRLEDVWIPPVQHDSNHTRFHPPVPTQSGIERINRASNSYVSTSTQTDFSAALDANGTDTPPIPIGERQQPFGLAYKRFGSLLVSRALHQCRRGCKALFVNEEDRDGHEDTHVDQFRIYRCRRGCLAEYQRESHRNTHEKKIHPQATEQN